MPAARRARERKSAPMNDTVRDLHRQFIERWNAADAAGLAALFCDDGSIVGFDGSMVNGVTQIEEHLRSVFADHQTARYVGNVREVRVLGDGAALLRAVVGMVPPGASDINPDVNAVQSLIAVPTDNQQWRIALLQTTPAQFHGRPDDVDALTNELRAALHSDA
jgi:uncharacterized protein (TIGR02246 family)